MPEDMPDEIEYQGKKIKLRKKYRYMSEFKNDPDNIPAGKTEQIQESVSKATVSKSYATRDLMVCSVSALQFPGYGLRVSPDRIQSDGSSLALFAVEIPRARKYRYLVFRAWAGSYSLVDDFICSKITGISYVQAENGGLVYRTALGETVRTHPLSPRSESCS